MVRLIKVKLDENLGLSHVELVRKFGHDADRITDEGLSGAGDNQVWEVVRSEERMLITLDLDFADIRRFDTAGTRGIVVLRPATNDRDSAFRVLLRVLNLHNLESFQGCLVVADEARTRIRTPGTFTES